MVTIVRAKSAVRERPSALLVPHIPKTHAGPSTSAHALLGSHERLSSHVQKEALRSGQLHFWLIQHPEFQRVASQGVQDGALEHIFNHVGTTNKYYVVQNACISGGLC